MISILLLSATLSVSSVAESQLLGTWVAAHRSTGGLGSMCTFMPAGKLEMSFGAIVESWYEINGEQLIEPSGSKMSTPYPLELTTIDLPVSVFCKRSYCTP